MELRAADALILSRNLSHENRDQSMLQLAISADLLAQKRQLELKISMAEMQAAYFKAGAPLRVCDLVISKYVPPWVIWHMPEDSVYDLVRQCDSLVQRVSGCDVLERIGIAHDFIVRSVSIVDFKRHKPTATITQSERAHMEFLKSKLRNSAKSLK